MTFKATPYHKNPCPGGHEIYNFLGHHYYILGLSDQCLGVEKTIYFRNTAILHFLPQNSLPLGWGVIKYTISCLLTLQMLHTKFG